MLASIRLSALRSRSLLFDREEDVAPFAAAALAVAAVAAPPAADAADAEVGAPPTVEGTADAEEDPVAAVAPLPLPPLLPTPSAALHRAATSRTSAAVRHTSSCRRPAQTAVAWLLALSAMP